jgi:arylsulfatase A-like enzyme
LPGAFRAAQAASAEKQPNILFIMSDDHAAHAISAYGSRLAKVAPTPNIDRLADEGFLFENCFCTNSICTPSRATILTGQYSQKNGVLDLSGRIEPERQYLPKLLKQAGYETAMIGKWHLKEEPAAFDYYCVLPGQGSYFNPILRESGGQWPKNERRFAKYDSCHSSDVITDLSLKWLTNRDRSKPFFLITPSATTGCSMTSIFRSLRASGIRAIMARKRQKAWEHPSANATSGGIWGTTCS